MSGSLTHQHRPKRVAMKTSTEHEAPTSTRPNHYTRTDWLHLAIRCAVTAINIGHTIWQVFLP